MRILLRLLARMPLGMNHALGAFLGRLVFMFSGRYRWRVLENLRASGVAASPQELKRLARENAAEIGKGATELAWALFRPMDDLVATVKEMKGWEAVERLHAARRPMVFVTPHLGGFDIAGRVLTTKVPLLAMYRPHKLFWLDQILREGRNRGAAPDGSNVAPANLAGVRMVLKHLRGGGCTVLLPDQVPGEGDGEWAEFFGRPAYTMTLPARLQQATGAVLVVGYAERLPRGEGFRIHFDVLEQPLPEDRQEAARLLNAAVERQVRSCPAQYLWGYNRYKHPAGAPLPPRGPSAQPG